MTATRTAETFHIDLQIDALRESPTNPRQQFDPAALAELAASIAESGVLVPLLVREVPDPSSPDHMHAYEIVAGARRFRAAKIAELETVPCDVRELSDAEAAEIQIIENSQRADVHPVEEAEGYRALQSAARALGQVLTAEDIAKRVGKPVRHVATMLKLLDLGPAAKNLFARGHLTLDHALLLAPLTPADQEGALRFMLDSDAKLDKREVMEIVMDRVDDLGREMTGADGEDADGENPDADEEARPVSTPRVAKYMREGRRLIDATPAQLKRWIEGNVLLRLIGVPWRLDDEDLTPAGPCTECEKRTGSNPALFGGFTAEEDTCTDRACFAAKQQATLKHHKQAAKVSGGKLLKISSKHSREELDEPAVHHPVDRAGVEVTKKTVKEGQWVPAEPKSCADAIDALMVDGPDKGKLKTVCANQKCKVHKHEVYRASSGNSGPASSETPEQAAAREAKTRKLIDDEVAIRKAVLDALPPKIGTGWKVFQHFFADSISRGAADICLKLGLAYPLPKAENRWQHDVAAGRVLAKYVMNATQEQIARVAFEALMLGVLNVNEYEVSKGRIDDSRSKLWGMAKALGVDANAIANRMAPKAVKSAPAKKAAAKTAVKKAVKKKAPAKKVAKPKKLSVEGGEKILMSWKARIAKRKAAAK